MPVPSHPTLIRGMLDRRLQQRAPAGPLLAASLAQVKERCGQPSCSCHHGGPLHSAHHLTVSEAGKTRTVWGPQDLLTKVQQSGHEQLRPAPACGRHPDRFRGPAHHPRGGFLRADTHEGDLIHGRIGDRIGML